MVRPRPARIWLPLASLSLLLLPTSCSPARDTSTPSSLEGTLSGTYTVDGVTTPKGSDQGRPIEGIVILVEEEDGYSSTFHLRSTYPGPDGNLETEVVGKGRGRVDGRSLLGTAETQILTAAFPGVDAKFPFLPRQYGPRVISVTRAEIMLDGTLSIEIETQGAEGQDYLATTSILTGQRTPPRGVSGFPAVGAERMARSEAEE